MRYLTVEEVLVLHSRLIATSGGSLGLRDANALDSAVAQPQMTFSLPFGTYNFTFVAPKLSPALAGKVEYLVVIQQFELRADLDGKPGNSSAKTYTDSKSNTAKRVRIVGGDYGKEGFDFEVGPQPQAGSLKSKAEIIATKPAESESETRKAKESKGGIAPQAMNVRGKIFLVEIGTTKIVLDQPGVKAPNQ